MYHAVYFQYATYDSYWQCNDLYQKWTLLPNYSFDTYCAKIIPSIIYQAYLIIAYLIRSIASKH